MRNRFASLLALGWLLCNAPTAHAMDDATRSASREIANAGVEAYQQDNFALASEKLEKAYSLLKAPAIGLWSARALVKLGKLVQASERYREVMRLGFAEGDTTVQKQAQLDAATELNALTPRIPSIVIQVTGASADALALSVDGAPVSVALIGEQRPVDPGSHVVEARAGARQARVEVSVAEGERKPAELSLQPMGGGESAPASAPHSAPASSAPTPAGHASGLGTQKTLAIVSGGIGVVGVAVGSVFGLQSQSKHARAADLACAGATCPTAAGVSASADARKAGNVSTIAFAVGVAGLAGGAVLWLTAKPGPSGSAQLGLGLGSVEMRGRW
jgi:hypothetical protein